MVVSEDKGKKPPCCSSLSLFPLLPGGTHRAFHHELGQIADKPCLCGLHRDVQGHQCVMLELFPYTFLLLFWIQKQSSFLTLYPQVPYFHFCP